MDVRGVYGKVRAHFLDGGDESFCARAALVRDGRRTHDGANAPIEQPTECFRSTTLSCPLTRAVHGTFTLFSSSCTAAAARAHIPTRRNP